jgi:hypothetical protein
MVVQDLATRASCRFNICLPDKALSGLASPVLAMPADDVGSLVVTRGHMWKTAESRMTRLARMLLGVVLISQAEARDLKVTWQRSAEAGITGYVVYYGDLSYTYHSRTNVGNVTNLVLSGFGMGRKSYFSVTAYNESGIESAFAEEVTHGVTPTITGLVGVQMAANASGVRADFTVEGGEEASGWTMGAASSNPALLPSSNVTFGGSGRSRYMLITPIRGMSGTATLQVFITDGTLTNSASTSITVLGTPSNQPPTLDSLSNLTISEDAGLQVIGLSGISSGGSGESQPLSLSAVSSNPSLIPNPLVTYTSANTTGSLSFSPIPNASGTATITVNVNDNQASNNLAARAFTVTVNALNDAPTLDPILDVNLDSGSGPRNITLTGIGTGAPDENQTISLSAVSSAPSLIPHPRITYTSSAATAVLELSPTTNVTGSVSITVTVDDGQSANRTVSRTFNVQLSSSVLNQAPVVSVGTNTSTQPNTTFMVRARITDDGLPATPGRVTAKWNKISGPGSVTIGNSNSALTTLRFDAQGMYRLRLTAFDGELTSSNDLIIFVRANTDFKPPTFTQVRVDNVTSTSISLGWTTDEATTEQVEFSQAGAVPLNTPLNQTLTLSHTVTVTNLFPDTVYILRARSRDGSGNLSYSEPVMVSTLRATKVHLPLLPSAATVVAPAAVELDADQKPSIHLPISDGAASFPFFAPVGGDYVVWARLRLPSEQTSLLNMSVNGGPTTSIDLGSNSEQQFSGEWHWVNLGKAWLLSGTHSLNLSAVEGRVSISRLLVTSQLGLTLQDTTVLLGSRTVLLQDRPIYHMPIRSEWSMITSPLSASDPSLRSLLPNPPEGCLFYKYDQATGDYATNLYTSTGWTSPAMTLSPGEGGLFFNPGPSFDWGVTGDVPSLASPHLQAGVNLLALTPSRGGVISKLATSFAFRSGDSVYRLDSEVGSFTNYNFDGQAWDMEPTINLGEACFLQLQPD